MKLYQTQYCLTVKDTSQINIKKCNATDENQQWEFLCYTKHYRDLTQMVGNRPDTRGETREYLRQFALSMQHTVNHQKVNSTRQCSMSEHIKW